jgi:glycosyltransferase involved in cell wall biosynthesis
MQRFTNAKVLSCSDVKWPRRNANVFPGEYREFSLKTLDSELVTELNESDLVVVYSVPSKSHPQATQDNFVELLRRVNARKTFINVDHNIQSINRNARLKDICEECHILLTHSTTNPFSEWAAKEKISTPLRKMSLGFDFDYHRSQYWLDVDRKDLKRVLWIGRTAGWKGPQLMIDFHNHQLRRRNYITVLEGLEANIGYKGVLYFDKDNTVRRKVVNYFRPEKEHGETTKWSEDLHGQEKAGEVYLYPPYNNKACMERMAKAGFGSDLYHLKPKMYGNNIENCHAEVIASGAVPIFHKHFGDHVIHKKIGDPVSKCDKSGTLFLDNTNFEEIATKMDELVRDEYKYSDFREQSFEFWKSHANIQEVVEEIINLSTTEAKVGLEEFFQ